MEEAGHLDTELELQSIDDDWRKNTTDAVAAQLREAGIKVKRTVLPGSTFWNDWVNYPFSSTNWNHRPLGTQVLGLAYRSGEAWNEAGFANEEFDKLLAEANSIADADKRRVVMAKLQKIMAFVANNDTFNTNFKAFRFIRTCTNCCTHHVFWVMA